MREKLLDARYDGASTDFNVAIDIAIISYADLFVQAFENLTVDRVFPSTT